MQPQNPRCGVELFPAATWPLWKSLCIHISCKLRKGGQLRSGVATGPFEVRKSGDRRLGTFADGLGKQPSKSGANQIFVPAPGDGGHCQEKAKKAYIQEGMPD